MRRLKLCAQVVWDLVREDEMKTCYKRNNRNWSFTKKGPGRRHNNGPINYYLRQLSTFSKECETRYRINIYTKEFWKRYDSFYTGRVILLGDIVSNLMTENK